MPSDLTEEQYFLLDGSERLNDLIFGTAQSTLAQQIPKKAGLQYMFHFQFVTRPVEKQPKETIQIHITGGSHWVCSGRCVKVYDSLYCGCLSDDVKGMLQKTYSYGKQLTVQVPEYSSNKDHLTVDYLL